MSRHHEPPGRRDMANWQSKLREALYRSIGEQDVEDIISGLVAKAKKGDLAAARFVLTYALGSPNIQVKQAVIVQPPTDMNGQTGLPPDWRRAIETPPRPALAVTEGDGPEPDDPTPDEIAAATAEIRSRRKKA